MKTARFYVQTTINLQRKCLGTPDCKNLENMLINFIWLNVEAKYLIQTISYDFKWDVALHRQNSPITQTTPEPTLLSLGGWPCEKISPHPWSRCQSWSHRAYQVTQTPLFSNTLMLPFDNQVCHEYQICIRFQWILKVILEMAFSAHCTWIWKLNRISMIIINKVARKCICCCHRVHQCLTAPTLEGNCAVECESVVKVAMSESFPYDESRPNAPSTCSEPGGKQLQHSIRGWCDWWELSKALIQYKDVI